MLSRLIRRHERWRARRDTARVAHPFDWGLEYLDLPDGFVDGRSPADVLVAHAERVLEDPSAFYADPGPPRAAEPGGVGDDGGRLWRFDSAVTGPDPATDRASVRLWEPADPGERAMVVLPQWNAEPESHVALCRVLARRGIAAARVTLPYHDDRRPPGEPRGDRAVSANLGRTLFAVRQAVADARRTRAWLEARGYPRVGVIGTSLGSCVAFLALAADPGFRLAVLHHVSSRFGGAVWRGLSTRHVRERLEERVDAGLLARAWAPIDPIRFVDRVPRDAHTLLLIGRWDLTFPYDLSMELAGAYRDRGLPHRTVRMPWGHYTSGMFPFNAILVAGVLRHLGRRL